MASILSLLVGLFGVSMVSSQLMSMFGGGEGAQIDPLLYLTASSGPGPNDIFSIQMRIFTAQLKGKMMAGMLGSHNDQRMVRLLSMQELRKLQAQTAAKKLVGDMLRMGTTPSTVDGSGNETGNATATETGSYPGTGDGTGPTLSMNAGTGNLFNTGTGSGTGNGFLGGLDPLLLMSLGNPEGGMPWSLLDPRIFSGLGQNAASISPLALTGLLGGGV